MLNRNFKRLDTNHDKKQVSNMAYSNEILTPNHILCENALPIAISTVPMQRWDNIYELEDVLAMGTLFKELYLPFEGRR